MAEETLAVPYERDPALYTTSSSASPKHNDSPDLARSSTEKLQSHTVSPLTTIFTLPSLYWWWFFNRRPSPQQRKLSRPILGLLQLRQHTYLAASFPPFLLQRIPKHISSSVAPPRPPFRQSTAIACSQSQVPSRAAPAFCHQAPQCHPQWERLSLHW